MFAAKVFATKMSTAKVLDRKPACVARVWIGKAHPTGPTPVFINQDPRETGYDRSLAQSVAAFVHDGRSEICDRHWMAGNA